jgi:hypothetical protein
MRVDERPLYPDDAYGVDVRTDRTVELKRIDLDYFEEAED